MSEKVMTESSSGQVSELDTVSTRRVPRVVSGAQKTICRAVSPTAARDTTRRSLPVSSLESARPTARPDSPAIADPDSGFA